MHDYMKALQQRFGRPSRKTENLERQLDGTRKALSARLLKAERRMLLRLTDMQNALRDQACLDSFMAGYRLAQGVNRELNSQPPYSFEADEEQRACETIRGER